jgi:hypothetical protein
MMPNLIRRRNPADCHGRWPLILLVLAIVLGVHSCDKRRSASRPEPRGAFARRRRHSNSAADAVNTVAASGEASAASEAAHPLERTANPRRRWGDRQGEARGARCGDCRPLPPRCLQERPEVPAMNNYRDAANLVTGQPMCSCSAPRSGCPIMEGWGLLGSLIAGPPWRSPPAPALPSSLPRRPLRDAAAA